MHRRQQYFESASAAKRAAGINLAAMPFGNLPTYRQSYASALEYVARMESLEDVEDAITMLFVEPNSVILHHNSTAIVASRMSRSLVAFGQQSAFHFDDWRLLDTAELQSVADQVLQQLPHLQRIGLDCGQPSYFYPRSEFFDLGLEVGNHLASNLFQIDRKRSVAPEWSPWKATTARRSAIACVRRRSACA